MNIRKAEAYDYDGINDIIVQFFEESLGDFIYELDPASILKSFDIMIKNHLVIIAIKDDVVVGIIAGTIAPCDFNYDVRIATEIIWYVNKKNRTSSVGVKLFKEFECQSEKYGATHIAMAYMENLQPAKIKNFYKDKGYRPMQTQYIRSLKK